MAKTRVHRKVKPAHVPPANHLAKVKKLTEQNKIEATKTRALDFVQRIYKCGPSDAIKKITKEILELDKSNFAHTRTINSLECDVYGKIIDAIPWYIKFCIDKDNLGRKGEFVNNLSFHPTEEELTTQSGKIPAYSGGKK
ncbi:hypothetical protein [Bdellovibrio sp. BCCA]|uniref:hypothetical protein n=1 Tax=Bdellovibrio sp. BCCA TaxID=3136281 RepID=UPI0030F34E55